MTARIRHLDAEPELAVRLREMGFCEDQSVRMVSQSHSVICQVCNVRLGLSPALAARIMVEPAPGIRIQPATPISSPTTEPRGGHARH